MTHRTKPLPLQGGGWVGDGSALGRPHTQPIPSPALPLKGREKNVRTSPFKGGEALMEPRYDLHGLE